MWNSGSLLLLVVAIKINIGSAHLPYPRLGGAVKVYGAYGNMIEHMMSIIRKTDSETWIYRESTVKVFENVSAVPRHHHGPKHLSFAGRDVKIKLCSTIDDLMKNYFKNFKFEGVQKCWQALSKDWSALTTAQRFGIDASYLNDKYSYALLKIERVRHNKKIAGSPDDFVLEETVASKVNELRDNETWNLVTFLMQIGSHYITSFVTGNSLYQVFVFEPPAYRFLESELNKRNLSEMSTVELSDLFSPLHAVQVGKIQSVSRNLTIEAWAAGNLRGPDRQLSYASLTQFHKNKTLHTEVGRMLRNDALLGLHLEILTPLFKDPNNRVWFKQYLEDYLQEIE